MHQKSPIAFENLEEESVLIGVKQSLGGVTNHIKVLEYEGIIQKVPRFEINNMIVDISIVTKEGERDGI